MANGYTYDVSTVSSLDTDGLLKGIQKAIDTLPTGWKLMSVSHAYGPASAEGLGWSALLTARKPLE